LKKLVVVYQEGDGLSMLLAVEIELAIRILTVVLGGLGQLFLACLMWGVLKTRIYVLPLPQRKDAIASSDITTPRLLHDETDEIESQKV